MAYRVLENLIHASIFIQLEMVQKAAVLTLTKKGSTFALF